MPCLVTKAQVLQALFGGLSLLSFFEAWLQATGGFNHITMMWKHVGTMISMMLWFPKNDTIWFDQPSFPKNAKQKLHRRYPIIFSTCPRPAHTKKTSNVHQLLSRLGFKFTCLTHRTTPIQAPYLTAPGLCWLKLTFRWICLGLPSIEVAPNSTHPGWWLQHENTQTNAWNMFWNGSCETFIEGIAAPTKWTWIIIIM